MKHTFICSLLVLTLIMQACGSEKKELKSNAAPIITVEVYKAETGEVARSISIPGTVLPNEQVDLYSEVAGRIQHISFKEGQSVAKGTVLVQVDTDILKAQLNQLNVQFDLAKKDEARKKALLESKGISIQEYEVSQAQLAETKAKLDLLNVQISKASVRAPFSGKIGLRKVSEGAFISTNTLITTIVQENPLKIEFSVPEKYAKNVRIGQSITFKLENNKTPYTGKIYAFESKITEDTRMLTVRAQLNNPGGIIAGQFVAIDYDLGKEENAYMIPAECIIPVMNGQKIYIAKNGIVEELPVELGIRTSDQVQVFGNLKPGDLILTTGLLAVRPGMPVQVKQVSK